MAVNASKYSKRQEFEIELNAIIRELSIFFFLSQSNIIREHFLNIMYRQSYRILYCQRQLSITTRLSSNGHFITVFGKYLKNG